ncbi:hypothetical protein [Lysinibacillus sphaericus]|uniref:hypothetical protein n=1 Tax=Lysinibacillus sphaericus TaxID=1421 RepID=UPI000C196A8F|nr:hypothetical protein [Lysinibacillus sphaericus]PIJ98025.1 hypothetical protein CTN02_09785 [Lysinibacillus sphaericus]
MVTYTRTATPARQKKSMLVRLEDDMSKKVDAIRQQHDLQTDQRVGIALLEYAIDAFERGEFKLMERSNANSRTTN